MGQEHSAELHPLTLAAGWTRERLDLALKLWGEGLSASEVAKAVGGVTRNAVIGMVHRRKLQRAAPSQPARTGRAVGAKRAPGRPVAAAVAVDPSLPASATLPGSNPKPWMTRLSGECCWPVGDGQGPDLHSCCNPVAERGWCAAHFAIGIQKPKPGQPRTGNELARSLRRWAA